MDHSLLDEIWETIFKCLPVASIVTATTVCKRWYGIIHSRQFPHSDMLPENPWCLMHSRQDGQWHAFDSTLDRWYRLSFPKQFNHQYVQVSSTCGLVCLLDSWNMITVCNPVTQDWKFLPDPPQRITRNWSFYTDPPFEPFFMALSSNCSSRDYTLTVVTHKVEYTTYAILRYESVTESWSTLHSDFSVPEGINDSVICNGMLCKIIGPDELQYYIMIMYDLSAKSSHTSLVRTSVELPSGLVYVRLVNLNGKLVLVGVIGGVPAEITDIWIWELKNNTWCDVARMPSSCFEKLNWGADPFLCFGGNDLIFICSSSGGDLIICDIRYNQWRWLSNEQIKFGRGYLNCFCFEPRLDMRP